MLHGDGYIRTVPVICSSVHSQVLPLSGAYSITKKIAHCQIGTYKVLPANGIQQHSLQLLIARKAAP